MTHKGRKSNGSPDSSGLSHRQWEQAIHSAGPLPAAQLPSCVQGLVFTGLTYPHNIPMEATAQRGQGNCSGSPSWETGLIWKPARQGTGPLRWTGSESSDLYWEHSPPWAAGGDALFGGLILFLAHSSGLGPLSAHCLAAMTPTCPARHFTKPEARHPEVNSFFAPIKGKGLIDFRIHCAPQRRQGILLRESGTSVPASSPHFPVYVP